MCTCACIVDANGGQVVTYSSTWACVTGINMNNLLKKTRTIYGEPVESAGTSESLNKHLGLQSVVEVEERKQENSHVSYMDILRSMDKVPVESRNSDKDVDNRLNVQMKRAMSMHPGKFDAMLLNNYHHKKTTPIKKVIKTGTFNNSTAHSKSNRKRRIKSSPLLRKTISKEKRQEHEDASDKRLSKLTHLTNNLTTKSTSMLKKTSTLYNMVTKNDVHSQSSRQAGRSSEQPSQHPSPEYMEAFLNAMNEFKKVLLSQRSDFVDEWHQNLVFDLSLVTIGHVWICNLF